MPTFDQYLYGIDQLEPLQASKSINLHIKNGKVDKRILDETVDIARKMGHFVLVNSDTYSHTKSNEQRHAIRITEKWAACNLSQLAQDSRLLKHDKFYKEELKKNPSQDMTAVEVKIKRRLIGDLLRDLVKLHDDLNVLHRDIKPDNALIFNVAGILCAKLADFDSSRYMYMMQKSNSQPFIATVPYVSPQFLMVADMLDEKFMYPDLRDEILDRNKDGDFACSCFGREIFYTNWPTITNKDKYKTMKSDYKDDMFSFGVMTFVMYTGHYPTISLLGKSSEGFNYMTMVEASRKFPADKELWEGLLRVDRGQRFSAKEALDVCERIQSSSLSISSNAPDSLRVRAQPH